MYAVFNDAGGATAERPGDWVAIWRKPRYNGSRFDDTLKLSPDEDEDDEGDAIEGGKIKTAPISTSECNSTGERIGL